MSRAVMISIKPQWVELIASGRKTVEVRKTRPKIDAPFKCYIYCTLAGSNELFHETLNGDVARWNREKWFEKKGKVVGEFVCDKLFPIFSFSGSRFWLNETLVKETMLEENEIIRYAGGAKEIYGWHISNLKMYDKPKELSEFHKPVMPTGLRYEDDAIKRPFQSWGYVEELE